MWYKTGMTAAILLLGRDSQELPKVGCGEETMQSLRVKQGSQTREMERNEVSVNIFGAAGPSLT